MRGEVPQTPISDLCPLFPISPFTLQIPVAKKKIATRKKPSSSKLSPGKPSFEESLKALESVVHKLEGGQLPLDLSLEQYEVGVCHLKVCYEMLEDAERRIELVRDVDAEGTASCEPFIETASPSSTASASGPGATKGRRSRKVSPNDVDDGSTLF